MKQQAWTMRTMEIGQHLIAVTLLVISCLRATSEGAAPIPAISVTFAFGLWYILGAIRAARSTTIALAVWWLLVLALLWLVSLVISAEFIWLAFLLWLLAGHLFSVRVAVSFTAVTYGATILAQFVHHGTVQTASVIGSLIGAVFALGLSRGYIQLLREAEVRKQLYASLERVHGELFDLQDELALTQRHAGEIQERTRISRDIHDTIAQEISSIRLIAHAEADRTSDPDARSVLLQVESLAANSSSDVRRIIAALAPAELEDGALSSAIRRLLTRLTEDTGIHSELEIDDSLSPLSTEVEVALLRTTQSALANVRRHSRAHRVRVNLMTSGGELRMDIVDDGVGTGAAVQVDGLERTESGFGLDFIRSRMVELGGTLEVESSPGSGFALSVTLPTTAAREVR